MTYDNFLSTITKHLQAKVNNSTEVKIHQIFKNNDTKLDGLSFHGSHSKASPTIYLNDYFIQYEEGRSLREITEEIYNIYEENKDTLPCGVDFFEDFNNVKHRIVYKIINYQSNSHLLATAPHKKFLDLAIVYYIIVDKNSTGNMTVLVQNQYLDYWKVDVDTIHRLSEHNTSFLLPYSIKNMEMLMQEFLIKDILSENPITSLTGGLKAPSSIPMYVLTNDIGLNGAACILYDNVLRDTAKKLESDLVILPSSIHEVIIIPKYDGINLRNFKEMVTDINQIAVQPQDRLTDQVYLYSAKTNCITLAV